MRFIFHHYLKIVESLKYYRVMDLYIRTIKYVVHPHFFVFDTDVEFFYKVFTY